MTALRPMAHPEDLYALAPDVQRRVLLVLAALRDHPEAGPLVTPPREHHRFRVNFAEYGIRALHVHATLELEARILYRLDGGSIEVVAIGPRHRSAVYQLAADRLCPRAAVRRLRHHRPMRRSA